MGRLAAVWPALPCLVAASSQQQGNACCSDMSDGLLGCYLADGPSGTASSLQALYQLCWPPVSRVPAKAGLSLHMRALKLCTSFTHNMLICHLPSHKPLQGGRMHECVRLYSQALLTAAMMACCRANLRLLALVALITALAAANSLVVPLALEGALARHVRTPALLAAAQTPQQGPPQPPSQWQRLLRLNNTTGEGHQGLHCWRCAQEPGVGSC